MTGSLSTGIESMLALVPLAVVQLIARALGADTFEARQARVRQAFDA